MKCFARIWNCDHAHSTSRAEYMYVILTQRACPVSDYLSVWSFYNRVESNININKFSVSKYLYNYHWAERIFLYNSTAANAQATKQITNIHRFSEPLFTVLWLVHVNSCIPARRFCSAVFEYNMYINLNKNISINLYCGIAQPILWLGYGFDIRQRQRILYGIHVGKVKLPSCFIMKMYWEWRYRSTLIDLSTRCRWVFSFTLRSLYPRRKSPQYPFYRKLVGL